jgi:hypothetical protein
MPYYCSYRKLKKQVMGAPGPDHETWKKMSKVDKIIYCISIAAGLSFTLYVAFSGYFK